MLATRKNFYEPITADLVSGDFAAAVRKIEAARKSNTYAERDRFLYFLDAGLAYSYASQLEQSNEKMSLAEAAAEELFTRSISRAAVSLLLNDNVLEYAGEDYEVLYANLLKAVNYLQLGSFDDAFVEIRRANLKLELLGQKYAKAAEELQQTSAKHKDKAGLAYNVEGIRFQNDAFARYLSMHMYAAEGLYDDARIDYEQFGQAFATQPHVYDFPRPDVRYDGGSQAILSITALVGLSPVKEALNLRIRTDKDLDLVQILYDGSGQGDEEYGHFSLPVDEDYYFKFAIPVMVDRPSSIRRVLVRVDGDLIGELQLLEDVGAVARETFAARKSLVYVRSVARAIAKGLAAHELKQKADKQIKSGFLGWLTKAAIDVSTDVIENADLRCSRLLPGRILVGDFAIEPGTYAITVETVGMNGATQDVLTLPDVQIRRGDFNLVRAVALH